MSREGYIYKLCCDGIDDFYIGSSWDMQKRKSAHKINCVNVNRGEYNLKVYKFIRENQGFDNWKFEILETALFENKRLREFREQHFIDTLKSTLNTHRAHITKEQLKKYNKDYNQTEKYKAYRKEYDKKRLAKINCACGIETNKSHQKRHENTKQHIKYITINNITNNIQNLHIHN